jgi:hypothetical protein
MKDDSLVKGVTRLPNWIEEPLLEALSELGMIRFKEIAAQVKLSGPLLDIFVNDAKKW